MSATTSAVSIATTGEIPVSVATTLFRHRGSLHLTVIVKARFAYTPDGPATIQPAPGIVVRDRNYGRSAHRSVGAASDLAPRLPRAQVIVVGQAYAPPGEFVVAGSVRLVVGRKETSIDRTLHVLGDSIEGARQPYQKMRVAYERAAFSDENPVGIAAEVGLPNLVDPARPGAPAAFGPISRYWPSRRDLLGDLDRGELDRDIPVFPDDFDWSYFHSAPVEQRLDALVGDEWILLDGMHPVLARVKIELPSAAAAARLTIADRAAVALDLTLDTVAIDADLQSFDLAWRGVAPLAIDESELGRVAIVAGLALPGVPLVWPRREAPASDVAPSIDDTEVRSPAQTQAMSGERVEALRRIPVAPFPIAAPGVPVAAAPIPGAPWPAPPAAPRFNAPPLDYAPPAAPLVDRDVSAGADEAAHEVTITGVEAPFTRPFAAPDLPSAAPPVLAAIPARVRPAIPIVNLSRTSALTVPWQVRPPQSSLTLLVKGTFDLVPDGAAALREESDLPSGEAHLGSSLEGSVSYPSDFAVFKPRADVTLTGTAHAPSGSAPFMAVRFRLGSDDNGFDRRLIVFGDRRWNPGVLGDSASVPEPFTTLPLVHERAFGGREFDANPVGIGHRSAAARGEIARLPNLEDPSHLIMRHDQTPRPVGFGPIPSGWKERRAKLGTYDNRWFRTRWPYFPEDFDWGYFQAAPSAQQLAYLRGDEPFEISGTHADRASLRGALPGLRMRGFAQRTAAAGGQIVEVPLQLDTVHFDTDAGTVSLVWRGLIEVSDEEAPELAAFLVLDESLGDAPITVDEAQARLLAALTPLEPVALDPDVTPAPANDEAPAGDASPVDPDEVAAMARLEALLVTQEQLRLDILRKSGLTDEQINAPPPEPPPPDPQAIAESLRLNGATEEEVAGFLEAMKPDAGSDAEERESRSVRARARALRLLEDRASFDGEDLADVDLAGLDFSGASLEGALLDGSDLRGCRFAGANLRGAQLGRADLTSAVLDGADLEGADLTSAKLTGATFVGAKLEGADFTDAVAVGAIFRATTGEGPSFAGADLTRADFTDAALPSVDFTAATIDGAVFERMIAPEIAIFDVVGKDVVFNDAELPRARAAGATLTGASLRRLVAPGSMWEGATLDGATFFGAELEGASFNRASCAGTVFSAADLGSAYFLRARLGAAQFLKSDAMHASFRGADLTRADLRGSNLHGADTSGATLEGADFELAIITQSLLSGDR
jgi:uncharacterized protein YjbI with pentapeptide repeats